MILLELTGLVYDLYWLFARSGPTLAKWSTMWAAIILSRSLLASSNKHIGRYAEGGSAGRPSFFRIFNREVFHIGEITLCGGSPAKTSRTCPQGHHQSPAMHRLAPAWYFSRARAGRLRRAPSELLLGSPMSLGATLMTERLSPPSSGKRVSTNPPKNPKLSVIRGAHARIFLHINLQGCPRILF